MRAGERSGEIEKKKKKILTRESGLVMTKKKIIRESGFDSGIGRKKNKESSFEKKELWLSEKEKKKVEGSE